MSNEYHHCPSCCLSLTTVEQVLIWNLNRGSWRHADRHLLLPVLPHGSPRRYKNVFFKIFSKIQQQCGTIYSLGQYLKCIIPISVFSLAVFWAGGGCFVTLENIPTTQQQKSMPASFSFKTYPRTKAQKKTASFILTWSRKSLRWTNYLPWATNHFVCTFGTGQQFPLQSNTAAQNNSLCYLLGWVGVGGSQNGNNVPWSNPQE